MLSPLKTFAIIVLISAVSLYIALPTTYHLDLRPLGSTYQTSLTKRPLALNFFGRSFSFNPQIKLGLDLQGGTHLVLQANVQDIPPADRVEALASTTEVIRRRIDLFGVSEPVIQTSINKDQQQYRIIIELPGVTDTQQAINLVGQTAQLEFKERTSDDLPPEATISALAFINAFQSTGLTGKHLEKATVQFDQDSQPAVGLKFTSEGADLFAQITERNVGKELAIFLDDTPVTIPVVSQKLTDGEAIISGRFTTDQAKALSIQLNAGALPVPIEVISQNTIGASLGQDSIRQSIQAGLIGLTMVMLFMITYYGFLGFLATIALIIYAVITLALYKILGVTLTMPGLAGFILSVGMAVDSNILIFERYKEEIRSGKLWKTAMEMGFGRAWDSIKDANVTTLLICFILFNPFNWNWLNTSGMVRGFALTLALGILISLFTGIVVTRTLIRLFYQGTNHSK